MKKITTFFLLLSVFTIICAQTNKNYDILIAKAGLSHLQKNHKKAVNLYEQAFKIQNPAALSAYKAAGAYSLENNGEKAFYYLQFALNNGWTEADWLISDSYFDYIKKKNPEKWKDIEKAARDKEQKYSKSLKLSSLRKEINLMTLKDQQLRFKRSQTDNDNLLAALDKEINQSDLNNLNRAKKIIQQYGWPTLSQIGKDGQNNLWLIAQHADQDVEFQKTALSAMEKLKVSEEINPENYAFLYDRVQCNLNEKQLYGTQVVWTSHGEASEFRPMLKEYQADERRKEMGMQSLEIYSLTYGFSYKNITEKESEQKDNSYRKQVQELMDKAKMAYLNKQFQDTYDFYNKASTFLGGMTDDDNFEAAVIFSKIATENHDEKYKGIALDFLDLLNIRNTLNKEKVSKEKAFYILKNESRWLEIVK